LQGAVREHVRALGEAGAEPVEVRTKPELDSVAGLIIPGGESTTVGKLLERFELMEPLRERIRHGMPVWGTCMGMILLAKDIVGSDQPRLGVMDVAVDSREVELEVADLGKEPLRAVFIRAPYAESWGPEVRCLARYEGAGVLLRQGTMLASSFHPELTDDRRLHRYFMELAA
jgi:5'-phosphate synthase pdxT subunit